MRNKFGTVCMVLGAVLILAALSLFVWNRQEDKKAGASVENILPQLMEQIERLRAEATNGDLPYPDPYDPTMTEVVIDGYAYIGYLSIPSLERELPVMSEWDYTRLKMAPCRYSGSTKTNDLVIAAHNYTRHFGPVRELPIGENIYFTDMDGIVSHYQVAEVEVLPPTDIEEMISGAYDLTLFTCNYGGQSRIAVRCEQVQE